MKKIEWIEYIQDGLSGGDVPDEQLRKFHPAIIEQTIGIAISAYLVQPDMDVNMKAIATWKLDALTRMVCLKVECDEKNKTYFIALPEGAIIMKNNQHVRSIKDTKDLKTTFVPRTISASEIYGGLDISNVSTAIPYMIIGNKIYLLSTEVKDREVFLYYVSNFTAFDDDEEINIPGEYEMTLYTSVLNILRQRPREDNINDNANPI